MCVCLEGVGGADSCLIMCWQLVHSGTSQAFYFTCFIFTLFYGGWIWWSISFSFPLLGRQCSCEVNVENRIALAQ